jgi:hypothetical protein
MANNPYAPPKAEVEAPGSSLLAGDPNLAELMFSPAQIFVACLLGGPIAAAWIAASNYKAIGQPDDGRRMIGWSVLACLLLLVITTFLPHRFPPIVLPIAYSVAIRAFAEVKFGAVVKRHRAAGGLIGSWWRVIIIALLGLVILVAFAIAVMVMIGSFGLVAGGAG